MPFVFRFKDTKKYSNYYARIIFFDFLGARLRTFTYRRLLQDDGALSQWPCRRRGALCAPRRMAGHIRLKINVSRPRGEAAGPGLPINPFQRPAIRRGHPPAGGGPNAGARAP